jgi:putative oxidoreductase
MLIRLLTRQTGADWGLLLLRLGFAAMLSGLHGWTRLTRAFNYAVYGQAWPFVAVVERLGFPVPAVFAVLSAMSESIAVVFVLLGIYTRPAAAVIAFNMTVATYNEASKGDPWELPALYLLSALVLVLAGPGAMSLPVRPAWSGRLRT